mgnify:FL=1
MANGILSALKQLGNTFTKPLVVRLDGNEVAAAQEILNSVHHPLITTATDMDGGAQKVARIVAERSAHASAGK